MQNGYYASAAGMVMQYNRLDVIANNLANVNTAGFKEDNLVVGDFMRTLQEARDELPHANHTKEGAQFLNRTLTKSPQIVDEYTDFSLGQMQQTDNALDFALSKEGLFFLVETPNGIKMTRDGSFNLDDEGRLVTKEGYPVLPSDYFESKGYITFATTDNIIKSDDNGQLSTNLPATTQMNPTSQLFIFQPDNVAFLKKEGDSLYSYEGDSEYTPLGNSTAVRQGYVEKSNVNAVNMMTQMIETNRLVGMYQKAMDAQMNDMNSDAIEKLAKRA